MLCICDGLIFLGDKLVVTEKLKFEMLNILHEGHIGIEKCKKKARLHLYWQNMNRDIEDYIFLTCEKFANKKCKESLLSFPVPKRSWERVGADIFSYGNVSYLVLYDAYSNWLEVYYLKNKSSGEVIKNLKKAFSRLGPPDKLVCDNVPFNSYEISNFAKNWNFDIVTRSLNYPRSNGLAEKGIGIAKPL